MLGHVVSQYACGDRGKPALCGAWCPTRTNRVWNRVVQQDGIEFVSSKVDGDEVFSWVSRYAFCYEYLSGGIVRVRVCVRDR